MNKRRDRHRSESEPVPAHYYCRMSDCRMVATQVDRQKAFSIQYSAYTPEQLSFGNRSSCNNCGLGKAPLPNGALLFLFSRPQSCGIQAISVYTVMCLRGTFHSPLPTSRSMTFRLQDVQKGRSARPQREKRRGVLCAVR